MDDKDKTIFDNYLHFSWSANDCIAQYEVSTVSNTVLTVWSKHLIELLETWPADKAIRLLYNISSPGASLTYWATAGQNIMHIGVDIRSRQYVEKRFSADQLIVPRIALVVSNALSGQAAFRLYQPSVRLPIKAKAFFDQQSAHTWLLEGAR